MYKQHFCGVLVALLVATTAAHADPISGASSGITGAATNLTFDEVALNTRDVVTSQYSSFGVNFSPNLYFSPQGGFPNITQGHLGNFEFGAPPSVTPFSILFDDAVSMATFSMAWNTGTSTFTALNDGQLVESFEATSTASNPNNFFGFENIVFDEIRIDVGGSNTAMLLDNLSFTSDVVPDSDALLFLMLATDGGELDLNSPVTWTTLSNTYSGVLSGGAFRIPEFSAQYEIQQVQNGVTQAGIFGGGDIPGGSPHVYSTNGLPIEADIQQAIVIGLDAINNNDPLWTQFLRDQGVIGFEEFAPDMNAPGATLEGIPGFALVDWFEGYYSGFRDPMIVRPELEMAVLGGGFTPIEASQTTELEIFPHDTHFASLGSIQIRFPEVPPTSTELVQLMAISSSDLTNNQDFTPPPAQPIPEPSSVVLMGLALVGGAVLMRRRRGR